MEDKKVCCGVYDYDGVLVDGEHLMDLQIIENCKGREEAKEATNIYAESIFKRQLELTQIKQQLEQERNVYGSEMLEIIKELADLERKIKRHFELKDQVLEETEEKYANIIDYDKIYVKENIYPGVLEALWEIYDKGIYVKLLNNTHVNKERESVAKERLLKAEFPPMEFVPILFHIFPYRDMEGPNNNRQPSDKVLRMTRNNRYINPLVSTYVDNSKSVIRLANKLGYRTYFVDKNDNPRDIIVDAANDTIDIVHGGKIKKLSR